MAEPSDPILTNAELLQMVVDYNQIGAAQSNAPRVFALKTEEEKDDARSAYDARIQKEVTDYTKNLDRFVDAETGLITLDQPMTIQITKNKGTPEIYTVPAGEYTPAQFSMGIATIADKGEGPWDYDSFRLFNVVGKSYDTEHGAQSFEKPNGTEVFHGEGSGFVPTTAKAAVTAHDAEVAAPTPRDQMHEAMKHFAETQDKIAKKDSSAYASYNFGDNRFEDVYTLLKENPDIKVTIEEIPDDRTGVRTARITFDGQTVEVPVSANYFYLTMQFDNVSSPQKAEYVASFQSLMSNPEPTTAEIPEVVAPAVVAPAPAPTDAPAADASTHTPAERPAATPPATGAPLEDDTQAPRTAKPVHPINYGAGDDMPLINARTAAEAEEKVKGAQRNFVAAYGSDDLKTSASVDGIDGKWGPRTQRLFEKTCELAGVKPEEVDLNNPDDQQTKLYYAKLAELAKERTERGKHAEPAAATIPAVAAPEVALAPVLAEAATTVATAGPAAAPASAAVLSGLLNTLDFPVRSLDEQQAAAPVASVVQHVGLAQAAPAVEPPAQQHASYVPEFIVDSALPNLKVGGQAVGRVVA